MTPPKWTGAAMKQFQKDGTLPDGDPEKKELSKAATEFEGALAGALRKMRKEPEINQESEESETEE